MKRVVEVAEPSLTRLRTFASRWLAGVGQGIAYVTSRVSQEVEDIWTEALEISRARANDSDVSEI